MALLYYLSTFKVVIAAPCSLRQVLNNFNKVMQLSERAMAGMEIAINDQFRLPADSFNFLILLKNQK